jgi:hypothetical protein
MGVGVHGVPLEWDVQRLLDTLRGKRYRTYNQQATRETDPAPAQHRYHKSVYWRMTRTDA